jgi:hypothetical protein
MKTQLKIYGQFIKIATLIVLASALIVGWSQAGQLASAQEPGTPSGELVPIVEPDSPVAEPTPMPGPKSDSDAAPEPTTEPDESDRIAPPEESEANEPDKQEPDPSTVKIIITVEPEVTPGPTDESGSTSPDPTVELDEIGTVEPPSQEALGEPIKDEAYITLDDMTDEEGGVIDLFDLTFVAARYDTDDPVADINLDGTVDIFDLTILASHYGQSVPPANAVIITPTPLPEVEASGADFGVFDLSVEAENFDTQAQYYVEQRPLGIGVSINYVKIYDAADSTSAPDPYALVSVGYVPVRTQAIYDRYETWPYWRLGWWRYTYFPWVPSYSSAANYYHLPINLEIRDDDGYRCYGYYGCRYQYEHVDVSSLRYSYTKSLTLYPSSCMVVDEAGTRTYGYWLDSHRCRVYLQSWGSEWPRGYVSYYIDASWQ